MRLLIVGAGGFGREVLCYARDAARDHGDGARFDAFAFLDDRPAALAGYDVGAEVVGRPGEAALGPEDRVVVAVGDPALRCTLSRAMAARGARFATLVHPTAYVAAGATLGEGTVLAPFTFVGPSARVGEHVALNTYASVGHDANVGSWCVFSPVSVVNGGVTLGEGVFLGTHSAVVVGRTVGAWAKLSAGAVATRDLASGVLAVGNPAAGRVMFRPPQA